MDTIKESVSVRPADRSDIAAISDIGTRVFTASFGYSHQPYQLQAFLTETYSHEATAAILDNPDMDYFVAVSPWNMREVLGFALLIRNTTEPCLSDHSNAIELRRIYVDSTSHGKGVGSALARHLDSVARNQGFEYIWLGVWEENIRAQKLYQKLGYRAIGEHMFNVGGHQERDLVMVKSLKIDEVEKCD